MSFDKNLIWALPTVQAAITEAATFVGNLSAQNHTTELRRDGSHSGVESPIEATFWVWWQTLHKMRPRAFDGMTLVPQYEVAGEWGTYRLDFAIPEAKVAVELDGHEFHERTKDQVIDRNARDWNLQAAGWTMLHFSGTEFVRCEVEAVVAVIEVAMAKVQGSQEK
jgi:very-short-patch-repair endonuclease